MYNSLASSESEVCICLSEAKDEKLEEKEDKEEVEEGGRMLGSGMLVNCAVTNFICVFHLK